MLEACAPGARLEARKHRNWVHYNGQTYLTYRGLPLGKHGKSRQNAEIEVGHVKKMARFFEILPCAKQHLNL